ncbi:MAG TPA: DUF5615 family PIN-like protein [Pirellulales bacterium]|jgi:predicted nuclease of predicted toxin-antitoxin system
MTDRIRFHLDENVAPAIAEGLRRRGVDVTTSQDAGLLKATDQQQLEFAIAQGRTLMTHDEDFLAVAQNGIHHAGIVYCHVDTRTIGQIVRSLLWIHAEQAREKIIDCVEYI